MKFEKNTKYNTYALLALVVVAFAALLISFAMHFSEVRTFLANIFTVITPLIYAFILVLILLPVVDFFEKKFCIWLKKKKNYHKKASTLSILCTYLLLIVVVVLCVIVIIPQFATLYNFALKFADVYLPTLNKIASDISADSEFFGDMISKAFNYLKETLTNALSSLPDIAASVAAAFGNVVSVVSNWLLAVIISIYAMLRRERLKALCRKANAAVFKENTGNRIADFCGSLYHNLMWFFSSRAYNMLAVALVFYVIFLLMGLKFYSVISLVIAVCSFVPIFGMLIGGGIGMVIVLVTDTKLTLWFVLVFVIVMVLDYIFLRPRITNKRVHVSIGTTLVCVLLGFFVWDILGALCALPIYVTLRDFFMAWHRKKKEEKRETVSNSAGE
ncbi:MAG: AI-2E family transporter [Clostridia bacterium]|nr:AI-2E family transporter [Clostridia bacterium]